MKKTIVIGIVILFVIIIALFYPILRQSQKSQKSHATLLERDGVVHIKNTLPSNVRHRVLAQVYQELANCKSRKIGKINNASNKRLEVSLHLTPDIKELLRHVWSEHKDVWTVHLGCSNPRLLECSAFITFPGAGAQDWHRDISYDPTKSRLLSIGVALQDVTESMGPLEVVKKTHLTTDEITEKMERVRAEKMMCTKDDLIVWNSSVHHRGSRNTSDTTRVMVNITFGSDGKLPDGPTHTLLPRYKSGNNFPRINNVL